MTRFSEQQSDLTLTLRKPSVKFEIQKLYAEMAKGTVTGSIVIEVRNANTAIASYDLTLRCGCPNADCACFSTLYLGNLLPFVMSEIFDNYGKIFEFDVCSSKSSIAIKISYKESER